MGCPKMANFCGEKTTFFTPSDSSPSKTLFPEGFTPICLSNPLTTIICNESEVLYVWASRYSTILMSYNFNYR